MLQFIKGFLLVIMCMFVYFIIIVGYDASTESDGWLKVKLYTTIIITCGLVYLFLSMLQKYGVRKFATYEGTKFNMAPVYIVPVYINDALQGEWSTRGSWNTENFTNVLLHTMHDGMKTVECDRIEFDADNGNYTFSRKGSPSIGYTTDELMSIKISQ